MFATASYYVPPANKKKNERERIWMASMTSISPHAIEDYDMITPATPPPPPIVFKSTEPTTTEKASLAILSLVDIIQTQNWLHEEYGPNGKPWRVAPKEDDPILGAHPTFTRMAVTGIAMDELILHIRSPFIRRFSIGLEAGNVARNFSIGMHL
jgi:hypothetical protein